jgi:DNA-directed RNA polymerase subunit RPC12/RpoP
MAVNCPFENCDFPIETDNLEDGEVIECPECGAEVLVENDGTKLTIVELTEDDDDFDEDDEEE